jgi:hypothetical protein
MVIVESEYVVDRLNSDMASRSVLFQMAVSSVISSKAKKNFDAEIKKLNGD